MHSNIPKLLADKKITVSQLSKGTGLSRTTLTELSKSNDLPQKTRVETLLKVSEYLHVPMKQLFGFEKLNVELLSQINVIDGGVLPEDNNVVKSMRRSEDNMPDKFLQYAGLAAVKINDYEKPLIIAYDSKLSRVNIEILGDGDRNLLFLLDATYFGHSSGFSDGSFNFTSQDLQYFSSKDCLNRDLDFISSFGINAQNEFLEQLSKLEFFDDLIHKFPNDHQKYYVPHFCISFSGRLSYYPLGSTKFQRFHSLSVTSSTDIDTNSRGIIVRNLVNFVMLKNKELIDGDDVSEFMKNNLLQHLD